MDILFELSDLLFDFCHESRDSDPERREPTARERKILDQIVTRTGEELVEKLLDAQEERVRSEYFACFPHGLRLGAQLLDLQSG